MADGAGTPYCADEGYFSPETQERLNRLHREEAAACKGHKPSCASLWQGKPCDCGKDARG